MWKDRITLVIALWGAVVATGVAVRDSVKAFYESLPQFFVRTEIDLDGTDKMVGHITVRIGNVGTPTAILDPTFYVLTINGRTGQANQVQLSFSAEDAPAESHGEHIPGRPPTLKTGEEVVSVKSSLVLPRAVNIDPMIVKFSLLGGRQYTAVIDTPYSFNRSKSTNEPVGWSGGSMATNTRWF